MNKQPFNEKKSTSNHTTDKKIRKNLLASKNFS